MKIDRIGTKWFPKVAEAGTQNGTKMIFCSNFGTFNSIVVRFKWKNYG